MLRILAAGVLCISVAGCSMMVKKDKPTCGDGIAEGDEECDGSDLNGTTCPELGCGGGVPACRPDCTYDYDPCECTQDCGDGICQFYESQRICSDDCGVLPTCHNNRIDPGEDCDGDNLNGATCRDLGYDCGILGCWHDCRFNDDQCRNAPVGCACEDPVNCPPGQDCLLDGFPGGYCSTECGPSCPGGAVCRGNAPQPGSWCYEPCGSPQDCRVGYRCDVDACVPL